MRKLFHSLPSSILIVNVELPVLLKSPWHVRHTECWRSTCSWLC